MIGYYRRKFNEGAKHVLPHRLDRLVSHGGALMRARDYDMLWTMLTNAIWVERRLRAKDSWGYDENRHIGLHQARTWLRRERAAEQRRIAA